MNIFCNECDENVDAKLSTGNEIYPHRDDLKDTVYWVCPKCGAYVGTHKNSEEHKPLGTLAGPELRTWRNWVHKNIDKYWMLGTVSRTNMYKQLSKNMNMQFHTATLKTKEECQQAVEVAKQLFETTQQTKRKTKVVTGD